MRPPSPVLGRGLATWIVGATLTAGVTGSRLAWAEPASVHTPVVEGTSSLQAPTATYDPDRGATIRSEAGWELSPYAMIAVRHQDETRGGALVERGFRLQATRLMLHASQRAWRTQFRST